MITKTVMRIMSIALLVTCLGASLAMAEPAANSADAVRTNIVLVPVGPISVDLMNRIKSSILDNYTCGVRVGELQKSMANSMEEEGKELAKLMNKSDLCVLGLVNIPEEVSLREATLRSSSVGLLNVWALKPGKIESEENKEQYARRVEKESLNVIGKLLGLDICPSPQCALSLANTEKQLDAKARDLCPPCRMKAEQAIRAFGSAIQIAPSVAK